jgi:hypothetical protein
MSDQFMNALGTSDSINTRQNIIAGPGPHEYYFHSPGAQTPMVNEEGPFPVQGNIGALVAQEAINYAGCINGPYGPNCTGAFEKDIYTTSDTCGSSCVLKEPENYGLQDFGFPKDLPSSQKITNAHQLHSYQNLRAGNVGQSSLSGCQEFIPNISPNNSGACIMNQNPIFSQVGEWNKLPIYKNIVYASFRT